MRQFDLHEFLGYITPGMLLILGIRCLLPDAEKVLPLNSLSLGEFGVGVVLAYAGGQLLQSIGIIVEKCWWWFWGGMPSDWVRTGKHELITVAQLTQVESGVRRLSGGNCITLASLDQKQWYRVTRQICAAISGAGRSRRIDIFNGHYGLCRGLVSCLVVLLILCVGSAVSGAIFPQTSALSVERSLLNGWSGILIAGALLIPSVHQMHHFGVLYAREVFVQFIELPMSPAFSDANGVTGETL